MCAAHGVTTTKSVAPWQSIPADDQPILLRAAGACIFFIHYYLLFCINYYPYPVYEAKLNFMRNFKVGPERVKSSG